MRTAWNKGKVVIDWNERIKERTNNQFELVNRISTSNGESKLLIRCSVCGSEKTIGASSIRGTNTIRCVDCDVQKTKDRHRYEKEQREALKTIERNKRKTQSAFRFCGDCGLVILTGQKKFCDDCLIKHEKRVQQTYSREQSRRADMKRRARMRKVKHDKGLTKEKLYERDNGICYLCGRVCDWNDGKWENGVFKVGKTYPTVEHLVPIIKGGNDTWDNVKLACVSCNARKGTKVFGEDIPLGA